MGRLAPTTIRLKDGAEILLRSLGPEDAAVSLAHARRFFQTAPYVLTKPDECPTDPEKQRALLADRLSQPGELFAGAFDGEVMIGAIGLHHITPKRKLRHVVEMGMGMEPPYRGRGLGRAMLTTVMDHAAADPLLIQVLLHVYAANTPARRLYESVGFVELYRRPNFFLHDDGTLHDDLGMAIYVKPGIAPPPFKTYSPARAT